MHTIHTIHIPYTQCTRNAHAIHTQYTPYITCREVCFAEPNRTNILNQLIIASDTETQCFPMFAKQFHGIQCINVIVHVARECSFSQGFPMIPGNHVNCFPMLILLISSNARDACSNKRFLKDPKGFCVSIGNMTRAPALPIARNHRFPKVF